MNKSVEIKAATTELAIERGLLALETSLENVEVEILSKGGLFQKAQVRLTMIEKPTDTAKTFVDEMLKKMNVSAEAIVKESDECVYIDIVGNDSGAIIGYRGETLDAIQYLTLTVVNNGEKGKFKKVVVNAENYREKREETLIALANRLANKAQKQCRKIVLEPMNPFERRIIHSSLQDSEIAETKSEGEEPNRHIVIIPKGVEIKKSSSKNNHGGQRNNRNGNGNRRGDKKDFNRNGKNHNFDKKRDYDRKPSKNKESKDSYDDYDNLVGKKVEPVSYGEKFDAPKKTGAPKFKSFGGKKGLPY